MMHSPSKQFVLLAREEAITLDKEKFEGTKLGFTDFLERPVSIVERDFCWSRRAP
jgi:hypothetical protein